MNWGKILVALLPLAYIVWWVIALYTVMIPLLNVPISQTLSLTWLDVIGAVLFFSLGMVGLIVAVVFLVALLT